jgi:hypothetical protein
MTSDEVKKFAAQAEPIADALLESLVGIVFEPDLAACDDLIRKCEGAVTFARALRVSLLNERSRVA